MADAGGGSWSSVGVTDRASRLRIRSDAAGPHGPGQGHREPVEVGHRRRPGSMGGEARQPGLLAREACRSVHLHPRDSAAALPGPPWLQRRRDGRGRGVLVVGPARARRTKSGGTAASTSSTSIGSGRRAPDRWFARRPGPSPSDRIHSLVSSLGPRSGLMVTIDGVLATVASSVADDCSRSAVPPSTTSAAPLLGSVTSAIRSDFSCSNDAFAVDPLVVDVAAGAAIVDPIVVVHVVSRERRRGGLPPDGDSQRERAPRPGSSRSSSMSTPGCWPISRPPPGGILAGSATPGDRPPGGAGDGDPGGRRGRAGLRQRPVPRPATPGSSPIRPAPSEPGPSLESFAVALGGELRPAADRLGAAGELGDQQAAGRIHRAGRPDARLPHPSGPPGPAYHQRPPVHGGGGRPLPLRLQRA